MKEKRRAPPREEEKRSDVTRRDFLKGASLSIAAVGVSGAAIHLPAMERAGADVTIVGPGPVGMSFTINGKKHAVSVEPWMTLLDMFRDRMHLTGAKRVCDRGACGACCMIVGGKVVNSCSMLAIDASGQEITTIEGISQGDQLSALQQAFVDCDALQCGFCTPGMVVACTALLERNPAPSREETAQAIAGNICRCGTYQNIFEAVAKAARRGGGRAK